MLLLLLINIAYHSTNIHLLAHIQGDIVLENLALKPDILTSLGLPLTIHHGSLASLRIQIPWANLFPVATKPVIVRLAGLHIIIGPATTGDVEAATKLEREEKKKRTKLEEYDKAKKSSSSSNATASDPTFIERLVASIVNNVQVRPKISSLNTMFI